MFLGLSRNKRYDATIFLVFALLGMFWNAQFDGHAQNATPTATITATPYITYTPPATDITLTGQITPAINTRPDGRGLKPHGAVMGPDSFNQPMDYHLVDFNGNDVKLSFDTPAMYDFFWNQFMAFPTLYSAYYTNLGAAKTPTEFPFVEKDITYTVLWQGWAGKWVTVTGHLIEAQYFQVDSIQEIQQPTETFSTPDLSRVMAPSSMPKATQITVIGYMVMDARNPSGGQEWYSPNEEYRFTDITGKAIVVAIIMQPNISTHIVNLDGDTIVFEGLKGKWAKLTGWIFPPPFSQSSSGDTFIYLQSVQEIVPPITITPTS